MEFGLDVSQQQLAWDELVGRVRYAEESGFDAVWGFDHFKALYGDPTGPCFEAWTTLAALAAVTERVRLGALVTGMTYRHPSILATEAVTIDHISNGRVELAVGASWFEGEHLELGIDFPPVPERARRLEEGVQVMKLLMTEDGANFDGRYYRLDNASYNPKPVQEPHIPIWIGASGEKLMLPIVGRHADVWHNYGSPADLKRKGAVVERAAEDAGRDPKDIRRATNLDLSESWDEVRGKFDALRELGYDYFIAGWPSEGKERLDEFVEKVLPELRA